MNTYIAAIELANRTPLNDHIEIWKLTNDIDKVSKLPDDRVIWATTDHELFSHLNALHPAPHASLTYVSKNCYSSHVFNVYNIPVYPGSNDVEMCSLIHEYKKILTIGYRKASIEFNRINDISSQRTYDSNTIYTSVRGNKRVINARKKTDLNISRGEIANVYLDMLREIRHALNVIIDYKLSSYSVRGCCNAIQDIAHDYDLVFGKNAHRRNKKIQVIL